MEFFVYTYGNYNDLVRAIQIVTRIITSPEFKSFLGITLAMSVFIASAYAAFSGMLRGGKVNYMWGMNIVLGAIFCFTLIFPKATVIIEDRHYGKSGTAGYFITIKDVPFGVALTAWFYSYTQDAITRMISTYGSPIISFEDGGMDVNYTLLTNSTGLIGSIQTQAPASMINMKNYINDCVMIGVAQGRINTSELTQPGTDGVWNKMKLGEPMGDILTTAYGNFSVTCNESHTMLGLDFSVGSPIFTRVMNDYCAKNNIGTGACQNAFEAITQGYLGKSARDFILTYAAATAVENVVESYTNLADKQTNISNAMAAVQAEKWLPKLRNTTFIGVLLLAPICFLLVFFAPGQVVRWYGGMFVWLILWGSVDQLFFVMYQYELYDLFRYMRSSGVGITQILDVRSDMLETMGMYGKMRWVSMGMSLAMCMGILKIGNHAMANMATGMGASVQQTAGSAASAMSGAGGTDVARDAMVREKARGWAAGMTEAEAVANQEILNYAQSVAHAQAQIEQLGGGAYGVGSRVGESTGLGVAKNTVTTEKMVDHHGGKEQYIQQASERDAAQDHLNTTTYQKERDELGGDPQRWVDTKSDISVQNMQETMGSQAGTQARANTLDMSVAEFTEFQSRGSVLTEKQAANLNAKGYPTLQAGDRIEFGVNENGLTNLTAIRHTAGGVMSSTYNNDGTIGNVTYRGVQDGREVSATYDGSGNLVNRNATSGSTETHNDNVRVTNRGETENTGNTTLWEGLRGDVNAIRTAGLFDGQGDKDAVIRQFADVMNSMHSQNLQDSSNISGRVSAGFQTPFGGANMELSANAGQSSNYDQNFAGLSARFNEISSMDVSRDEKEAMLARELGDWYQIGMDTAQRGALSHAAEVIKETVDDGKAALRSIMTGESDGGNSSTTPVTPTVDDDPIARNTANIPPNTNLTYLTNDDPVARNMLANAGDSTPPPTWIAAVDTPISPVEPRVASTDTPTPPSDGGVPNADVGNNEKTDDSAPRPNTVFANINKDKPEG